MLSLKIGAHRRRNKEWMCAAVKMLDDVQGLEREDHACTLVKLHFGPHLCWCGWSFKDNEPPWQQPRLPGA